MNCYLIQFTYDFFCQGYEDATISILVYAENFEVAKDKIKNLYQNAHDFVNLTIGI